jgi:hypothetical protein
MPSGESFAVQTTLPQRNRAIVLSGFSRVAASALVRGLPASRTFHAAQ